MDFKTYWQSLSEEARESLADKVGFAEGHLRNIAYGSRTCGEKLAISIEKETDGRIRCEDLRPDVDWQFLRNTAST